MWLRLPPIRGVALDRGVSYPRAGRTHRRKPAISWTQCACFFRWAVDVGSVKTDPTSGVKNPGRRETAGFPVWTEDDLQRYERHCPIGTKERVWLGVLLYTGLRRGDAVRLGRQHVRDGVATVRTEKTGVTVTIPILPSTLMKILQGGPDFADLAFICGENRRQFTKGIHSATCFAKPATRPGWRSQRPACARSARRGPGTTAPPLCSWKAPSSG